MRALRDETKPLAEERLKRTLVLLRNFQSRKYQGGKFRIGKRIHAHFG